MSTKQVKQKRAKYPSDISKNGWEKLKPLLPTFKTGTPKGGRPKITVAGLPRR